MKVTVNQSNPDPKLVAVVGTGRLGLYIRHPTSLTHSIYLTGKGEISTVNYKLEDLADRASDRKPVYEGDTVTLEF